MEYTAGPQLVIAGAGSGKTRVLTYKIVHLLQLGMAPWQIMALTFTNKAAREMRERVENLVGHETAAQLWMGTFHSIFARILRQNADKFGYSSNYTIYDATDSKSSIKLIIKDMELDDKVYKPAAIQARISLAKNNMIGPEDYEANQALREEDRRFSREKTGMIYKTYCDRCRIAGALDFDDLLYYTNILLRDNPDVAQRYQNFFRYILIDEYQDTNFAQHIIVKQLAQQHQRICAVGDDAQSIYSFRGANIGNILSLEKQYPGLKTFKLEQNYRSTQNIIGAANSLIEKNKRQIRKHIFSQNELGEKVHVVKCSTDYEAAYVIANTIVRLKRSQGGSYEDFAVLYRTNAQSRIIEKALRDGGLKNDHGNTRMSIPYRIWGGLAFYQRKEVKDAVCYFRMAINPDNDESLRRIINYPQRGIGGTTMGKIQSCAVEHNVSMWQVVCAPARYGLNVNKGTLKKLDGFKVLIQRFIQLHQETQDAYLIAQDIITRAQLLAELEGDNTPENISRQENLKELLGSAKEFVDNKMEETGNCGTFADFLNEVALATDQDQTSEEESKEGKVTLMTVHAAKGLEFKNVIIAGVEEHRFPSSKSMSSLPEIEEERRLLYVAITRAMSHCTLLVSESPTINGMSSLCSESRFIHDIDPQFLARSSTSFSMPGDRPRREFAGSFEPETRTWPSGASPMASVTPPPAAHNFVPPRRLTPIKRAADTAPTAGAKHQARELKEGMLIRHNRFGEGVILSIDTASDAKIIVKFNTQGMKTLLLKFAVFDIME